MRQAKLHVNAILVVCSLFLSSYVAGTGINDIAVNAMREAQECCKIFGLSVTAAVTYGILNDQVSARISPEYFAEGFHKRMRNSWVNNPILARLKKVLENTQSPTIVGIIWGTVATWWMGALLAIPVIAAARVGSWPQLNAIDLIKPTSIALAGMGFASLCAGIRGYREAIKQPDNMKQEWQWAAGNTPPNALNRFIAAGKAHQMAYASGAIAGLGLASYAVVKRCTLAK